mgnify:CR=1 FL=1
MIYVFVYDGLTIIRLPAPHGHMGMEAFLWDLGDLGCPLIRSLDKLGLPLPNLVAYAPNFSTKCLNLGSHAKSLVELLAQSKWLEQTQIVPRTGPWSLRRISSSDGV